MSPMPSWVFFLVVGVVLFPGFYWLRSALGRNLLSIYLVLRLSRLERRISRQGGFDSCAPELISFALELVARRQACLLPHRSAALHERYSFTRQRLEICLLERQFRA